MDDEMNEWMDRICVGPGGVKGVMKWKWKENQKSPFSSISISVQMCDSGSGPLAKQ